MDFDKAYPKEDTAKVETGVWQPISDSFKVLVRKAGNEQFIEATKKTFRPHRVAIQRNLMPDKDITALACKVLAKTILVGWEGDATFGGQPVGSYSVARAEQLLNEFPRFREDVVKFSEDEGAYAVDAVEAEVKNSSSTSSGSSSGASSSQ